jgi:cell division protein FtsN
MIQSQGTFIFIAATVAVLVTVAAVVIVQVLHRKRDRLQ